MVEEFALFGSREGSNTALPPLVEAQPQGTQKTVPARRLAAVDPRFLAGSRGPNPHLMVVGPDVMTFDRSRGRGNWPPIHIRDIRRSAATREARFSVSCIFMQYVRPGI